MMRLLSLSRLVAILTGYSLWSVVACGQPVRFTNQTEVGLLSGSGALIRQIGFTLQAFNGVRLNEFAELGATVGLDAYPEVKLLPLAFGWRGVVPAGNVSPFLGLDVGYGFDWLERETDTDWYGGGLLFNPSVGIRIQSKGTDRFILSLGYKRQHYSAYTGQLLPEGVTPLPQTDPSLPPGMASLRKDAHTLQRMSVRLGLMF